MDIQIALLALPCLFRLQSLVEQDTESSLFEVPACLSSTARHRAW